MMAILELRRPAAVLNVISCNDWRIQVEISSIQKEISTIQDGITPIALINWLDQTEDAQSWHSIQPNLG